MFPGFPFFAYLGANHWLTGYERNQEKIFRHNDNVGIRGWCGYRVSAHGSVYGGRAIAKCRASRADRRKWHGLVRPQRDVEEPRCDLHGALRRRQPGTAKAGRRIGRTEYQAASLWRPPQAVGRPECGCRDYWDT